jgi:hypothetical protein
MERDEVSILAQLDMAIGDALFVAQGRAQAAAQLLSDLAASDTADLQVALTRARLDMSRATEVIDALLGAGGW